MIDVEKMSTSWFIWQFVLEEVLRIAGPVWVDNWATQSRLTWFLMPGESLDEVGVRRKGAQK